MKKIFALLVALACIFTTGAAFGEYVEGEALVVFKLPEGNGIRAAASDREARKIAAENAARETGAYIISTFDGLTELSIQNYENGLRNILDDGAVEKEKPTRPGIFAAVHSDTLSTEELIKRLKARDDVLAVSPNHIVYSQETLPNDPGFGYKWSNGPTLMWGITSTNAPYVWDYATGGPDIYVAIIDTGVDFNHKDIAPNFDKTYSENFYHSSGNPAKADKNDYGDYRGHGTLMAGVIAAKGNDNHGIAGMLWDGKIIALRHGGTLEEDNRNVSMVIAAFNKIAKLLTDNPDMTLASVNMSLAYGYATPPAAASSESDPMWLALHNIDITGRTILVAAACNENHEIGTPMEAGYYYYPANFRNLTHFICVGAAETNPEVTVFKKAGYSNYSKEYVHIAAPGTLTSSTKSSKTSSQQGDFTINGSKYMAANGTSMAAPYVTGGVALLRSAFPNATMLDIRDAIFNGANKNFCITDNNNNFTKYGFLDLKGAYDILKKKYGPGSKPTGTSTAAQVKAALNKLMTKTNYKSGQKNIFGTDARSFANQVYTKLFNVSKLSGFTKDNSGATSYVKSVLVGSEGSNSAGNIAYAKGLKTTDTAKVKNLFTGKNVKPGCFVQMSFRSKKDSTGKFGKPHSAIIYDVTSSNITLYHVNPSGTNKIAKTKYTWKGLLALWDKFRIYSPQDYTLKLDDETLFTPPTPYGDNTYYFITSALSPTADQDHNMAITADSGKTKVYLTRRSVDVPRDTAERTQVYSRLFRLSKNSDGSHSFINALTGKTLAIPDASTKKTGVQLQQATVSSTARGQKFMLLKAPSGYSDKHFMIQNIDGMYIASSSTTEKSALKTAKGTKAKSQVFFVTPINISNIDYFVNNYVRYYLSNWPEKFNRNKYGYFIVSVATGHVLGVDQNNNFVSMYRLDLPAYGKPSSTVIKQRAMRGFQFVKKGTGFNIVNVWSGKALDLPMYSAKFVIKPLSSVNTIWQLLKKKNVSHEGYVFSTPDGNSLALGSGSNNVYFTLEYYDYYSDLRRANNALAAPDAPLDPIATSTIAIEDVRLNRMHEEAQTRALLEGMYSDIMLDASIAAANNDPEAQEILQEMLKDIEAARNAKPDPEFNFDIANVIGVDEGQIFMIPAVSSARDIVAGIANPDLELELEPEPEDLDEELEDPESELELEEPDEDLDEELEDLESDLELEDPESELEDSKSELKPEDPDANPDAEIENSDLDSDSGSESDSGKSGGCDAGMGALALAGVVVFIKKRAIYK